MDGYEFMASLIGSLAWPAAMVGTAVIFKKNISALLPRLHLKYKDFDLSFLLGEAEKDASLLPTVTSQPEVSPTPEEYAGFLQLSKYAPRIAMGEIRREFETAVTSLAKTVGMAGPRYTSVLGQMRMMKSKGIISDQLAKLLDDLRYIGNSATQNLEVPITAEEAARFRELTTMAVSQLAAIEAVWRDQGGAVVQVP